jgi:predicted amidohydrolase
LALALPLATVGLDLGNAGSDAASDDGIVLAVAQFDPARSKADNLVRIAGIVSQAGAIGADVLVLPELATTLYPWALTEEVAEYVRDSAEAVPDGPTFNAMSSLARDYGMVLCWGMVESGPDPERPYNSMVLVGPDGSLLGVYRKLHLVPGVERAVFTAGDGLTVYETPLGSAGMLICYDRRFPELARTYALLGARLLLVGAATTDEQVDSHILATRAYENAAWLLFANQVGPSVAGVGRAFHGGARIVDPTGATRAEAQTEEAELVWVRVDDAALSFGRSLLDGRRSDAYAASGALLWADREETQALVESQLFPEGTAGSRRLIVPEVLPAGTEISDWDGPVQVLQAPSWFVFIDDAPEANWGHPCRYVFVDAVTREMLVLERQLPPRRLEEMVPF